MAKQSKWCLYGGTALTMDNDNRVVPNAVVWVAQGKIEKVESNPSFTPPAGMEAIDASGTLVTPGFVNGHTHSAMTLLRGIAEDLPLERWLMEVIFPAEQKHANREFVYAGTRLAALEMIRSGTTTFNDMYYFEEEVARASHEVGMRAVCGETFIETNQVGGKPAPIREKYDAFLEKVSGYPLVVPALAPHAIYSVSRANFEALTSYAADRNLRIHLHLSEREVENQECRKLRGKSPTEYLDELSFWSSRVTAAHATCLTEKDIRILGDKKVGIVHNPESNLKLGTLICPVPELVQAGCAVGLGTDSVASNNNLDLLQEVDFAAKLQAFRSGPGKFPALSAFRMMTIEGAKALGLGDKIGSLEVGKEADINVIELNGPHSVPFRNPYTHLVYSGSGADVRDVFIAGRAVMRDRKFLTVDESAILEEGRRWGRLIT